MGKKLFLPVKTVFLLAIELTGVADTRAVFHEILTSSFVQSRHDCAEIIDVANTILSRDVRSAVANCQGRLDQIARQSAADEGVCAPVSRGSQFQKVFR